MHRRFLAPRHHGDIPYQSSSFPPVASLLARIFICPSLTLQNPLEMTLPSHDLHLCGSSATDAALGEDEGRRRKHPRNAFIAWFEAHPARHLACRDGGFVAEFTAHPLYCLASRSSVRRLEVMFRCRSPSQAHAQQWHVHGIDVGLRQRGTLLVRAVLCELLVLRLMRFRGAYGVRHPQHHATCVVSRRHFLVSKNLADGLFQQGQRLCEQQRYSEAAKSWAQAALLQHAPSHAFLSHFLIEGKPDVPRDRKRAFELAAAGAATGCAHCKGTLGRCFVIGAGIAKDEGKGLALGRESAAAGSCFGQFVVASCYSEGVVVAQNRAEAARWYVSPFPLFIFVTLWQVRPRSSARSCRRSVRIWRFFRAWNSCCAERGRGFAMVRPCDGAGTCGCSELLGRQVSSRSRRCKRLRRGCATLPACRRPGARKRSVELGHHV